jgi:hypothetical protein
MKVQNLFYSALIVMLISFGSTSSAQRVETGQQTGRVTVRNVTVNNNVISGEVLNDSPNTVRDVELLFQYHWLWNNEFKPGNDPPGTAVYFSLNKDLRPGESTSFTYTPQPSLPSRADGQFMVEVSVASFAEVIQQRPSERG